MTKAKLLVALAATLALTSVANAKALSDATVTTDTITNLDVSWIFDLDQATGVPETSTASLTHWSAKAEASKSSFLGLVNFYAGAAAGYGSGAKFDFTGLNASSSDVINFSTSDTVHKVTYALSIMQDTAQQNLWTIHLTGVAPVPEPETYAMFLAGLGLMGAIARRRKNG